MKKIISFGVWVLFGIVSAASVCAAPVRDLVIEDALMAAQASNTVVDQPLGMLENSIENVAAPALSAKKSMAVVLDPSGKVSAVPAGSPSMMREEIDSVNSEARVQGPTEEISDEILKEDAAPAASEPELSAAQEKLDRAILTPETETTSFWPVLDHANPRHKWDFGMEAFSYSYSEPEFAELEGMMWGLFANYDYRWRENEPISSWKDVFASGNNLLNLLRLESRVSFGELDYYSYGTGEDDGINNYAFELRASLFSLTHSAMMSRAPASASSGVSTFFSGSTNFAASARGSKSPCAKINSAKGSRPFSRATVARVRRLGLKGRYTSSNSTSVSMARIFSLSSSVSLPCFSIVSRTVARRLSSSRNWPIRSRIVVRATSSRLPVASLR